MNLLFPGKVVRKLNYNYLKMGSKAFYVNQVWLSKFHNKTWCRLNLLYYNAHLVSLVYLVYRHLFGLKRYMRNSDDVAYWYNSTQAIDYVRLYVRLKKRFINPVQFLSMRFSSFRYQQDKYHHIYDFRIKDILNKKMLSKFYEEYQTKKYYYFLGNSLLDVAYEMFNNEQLVEMPFLSAYKEMKWDWLNYVMTVRKWLRESKLGFKGHFHHYPDTVENHYRFKLNGFLYLLGLPEEYIAFPVVSKQFYGYTNGFTKHLKGYTASRIDVLEIPKYKLYDINVTVKEVNCIKIFSELGSPDYGL